MKDARLGPKLLRSAAIDYSFFIGRSVLTADAASTDQRSVLTAEAASTDHRSVLTVEAILQYCSVVEMILSTLPSSQSSVGPAFEVRTHRLGMGG